jgi:peptidoglycan hydrolase-like protein with peptidoglycan-binding domain
MKVFLRSLRAAAVVAVAVMLTVTMSIVNAQTPSAATLTESTIRALQEALNKQGIAAKVDGVLTDGTRAAIRTYQSQHHLPVTGEPDKATLDKLGVRSGSATGSAQAQPDQPGMGSMSMMNMTGGMPMMNMMGMMRMGMMGSNMGGIATIDRVEGRIAFLRTELKITDTQASVWNGFADALRANAKKLGEVRSTMMSQQASTLADRLALQEQWLSARLEGTRSIKSAVTSLYEALSDEQKKAADELLAPHMGMGMMMMQPGQMGSGRMRP